MGGGGRGGELKCTIEKRKEMQKAPFQCLIPLPQAIATILDCLIDIDVHHKNGTLPCMTSKNAVIKIVGHGNLCIQQGN
jgi:hypothetical protein